jgi:hypothetical protein
LGHGTDGAFSVEDDGTVEDYLVNCENHLFMSDYDDDEGNQKQSDSILHGSWVLAEQSIVAADRELCS